MRIALVVLAALLITACSSPRPGAKITAAAPESRHVTTTITTTTSSVEARPPLGQASDIRAVDWPNALLPAEFCHVEGLVQFHGAEASAYSSRWGEVHLFAAYDPKRLGYGDLDGDGREEAAVDIGCDNGGGTAGGQLGFGYAVVTVRDGVLELIGEVGSTTMRDDAPHVPLLGEPSFEPGAISVVEHWYRPGDATCCPSAKARTIWRVVGAELVAGPVVQIS